MTTQGNGFKQLFANLYHSDFPCLRGITFECLVCCVALRGCFFKPMYFSSLCASQNVLMLSLSPLYQAES